MDVLMVLLKIIIMVAVPVLTSVMTYFLKKYLTVLIEKYTDGKTEEDLKKGLDIILASVDYVQQTYVDDLKKNNSFTEEAHKQALNAAKEKAIKLMNEDISNAIEKNYGNVDEYVETIIEHLVSQNKAA